MLVKITQETNSCQILSSQTDEPVAHHTYQMAAPKFNPLNLAMMNHLHPSIFCHFSGVKLRGQQSAENPRSPSAQTPPSTHIELRHCQAIREIYLLQRVLGLHCSILPVRHNILSIKTMNRISDKGQPWRIPIPTENKSDLLPAIWTKLLLRLYRDRMTHNIFWKSTKHL